ncbi:zinc finger protein 37 homolog [Ostrinia nubilalis]|uniref:zinc finger protein 37 homolog n=1 Tax=Ostrinia nubilalis TaxID=29057 RepID=UPI00308224E2
MLHNTGSYGPNEAPVNMGAPVNVSQLGAPLNVAQNLSNLGKTPQHPPQAAGGHFSLPNYASYMAANPNMGPQMHTFPNYQSLGLQSSYMHHNSPALPNMSWQNSMLPMNFNFHNEAVHNASNYTTSSTRASSSVNSYKEQIYTPKVPLNVPQVPNNFFLRHFEEENDRQTLPNHIKPIENELSSNCSEKPFGSLLKDNPRRKNLENTVRLIENILVNTTKNREMQLESQSSCAKNVETDSKNMNTKLNNTDTLSKELQNEKTEERSRESKTDEDSNGSDRSAQKECDVKIVENKETTNMENLQELEISIKLEPEDNDDVEEIREVEVKIEPITSWTDTEHTAPFHRDVHGVLQEDIGRENVIDSENSVLEATKIIVNKETSDNYFECPYCCLIFKHPKRFLIHTKWHLFGLINEQRLELAKEKESRRNQRKETRQKGAGAVRKPWPCKDCDKVFHAKGGLESHRKRFHSNRIRECKMCSKSVDGWTAWKAHIATHKSELGYQCTHCPKRFKYSHSLTKHKDTHLVSRSILTIPISRCRIGVWHVLAPSVGEDYH